MDEFNRLAGDFYDFRQEVIDSSTIPLASVAAIGVTTTPFSATFTWENPAQTQGVPTHVRVRIAEFGDTWAEYVYPITTWTAFGLQPNTTYTFQIQLVRRASGTVSFVSALRNCPSLPVQTESLSEIRSRTFTTDPGLGPPTDPGGGGTPIFPIPPTNDPGPVGGIHCWWEWQIQVIIPTTGEWADTTFSGTVAGDAGNITFDVTVLDPMRVYRVKYREVCNGVPGPWLYGNPFTGGADWLGDCGGNDQSASRLVTPGSTADLFAIPYACMTDGLGIRILDAVSNLELIMGTAFDFPVFNGDDEWNLVAKTWSDSPGTKLMGATTLPTLLALTNADDLSFEIDLWVIQLPTTPGGFGGGNIMDIGGGRIQFNIQWNPLNEWGISFLIARESGGNIVLTGPVDNPIGYTNPRVNVKVVLDQDGNKTLYVNDVAVAVDITGEEMRLDGMSGVIQLRSLSNTWIREVYGWSEALVLHATYTDDFNRAANLDITDGGNKLWIERVAPDDYLAISGTQSLTSVLVFPIGAAGVALWNADLTANHFVEWDVYGAGTLSFYFGSNNINPTVVGNVTYETFYTGGVWTLRKTVAGVLTVVTTTPGSNPAGTRIRIERQANDIRIYLNTVLQHTWTDSTYHGGYVGIRMDNNSHAVDNFSAGTLT